MHGVGGDKAMEQKNEKKAEFELAIKELNRVASDLTKIIEYSISILEKLRYYITVLENGLEKPEK